MKEYEKKGRKISGFFALVLAAVMTLSMAACGNSGTEAAPESTSASVEASEQESTKAVNLSKL